MNSIISIIITLAMMLSGTSSLPATPETTNTITISEIEMAIGEKTGKIDSSLIFENMIAENHMLFSFHADENGDEKMMTAVKISDNGLSFMINDPKYYYTIPRSNIDDMLQLDQRATNQLEQLLDLVRPLISYAESLEEREKAVQFLESVYDAFITANQTDAQETSIHVFNEEVQGIRYTLSVSESGVLKTIDLLETGDNAELAEAIAAIHGLAIGFSGQDIDSFESLSGESDLVFPMNITRGVSDDGDAVYYSFDLHTSDDGFTIGYTGQTAFSSEMVKSEIRQEIEQSTMVIRIDSSFEGISQTDEKWSFEGSYNIYAAASIDEKVREITANESSDDPVMDLSVKFKGIIENDHANEMEISGKLSGPLTINGETMDLTTLDFLFTMAQTAQGTDYLLNIQTPESDKPLFKISFNIKNEEKSYENRFAGEEIMIDLTSEEPLSSTQMIRLMGDGMNYAGDFLKVFGLLLPEDFNLNDIAEIFDF